MNDHASSDLAAHERSTEAAELRYTRVEEIVRAELHTQPDKFYEALGQWCPGADPNDGCVLIGEPFRKPPESHLVRKIHENRSKWAAEEMHEIWLGATNPQTTARDLILHDWLSDLIGRYVEDEVERRVNAGE